MTDAVMMRLDASTSTSPTAWPVSNNDGSTQRTREGTTTTTTMTDTDDKSVDCGPDCFQPCTAECHTDCGDDCDWMHPVKSCQECSETINESLREMLSPELDEAALQEILACCCCETSINSLSVPPAPAPPPPSYRCEWGDCLAQLASHEELTAHVLKDHLRVDQTTHSAQLDLQFRELEETLKASIRPPRPQSTARQGSLGPPSTQTLLLEHAAHSMLPPHDPTDHPLLPHTHPHALPPSAPHVHHHHHHHHHHGTPESQTLRGHSRQSSLVQRTSKRNPAQSSPYGPYSARPSAAAGSSTTSTPPALTMFGEEVGPSPRPEGTHSCLWEDCPFNPSIRAPHDRVGWMTTGELMEHIGSFHMGRGKKSYVCRWADCCVGKKAKGKVKDEDVGNTERKTFVQRQKAMRHVQMHTGDKPFECTICGRSFSEAKTLEQHIKGHQAEASVGVPDNADLGDVMPTDGLSVA